MQQHWFALRLLLLLLLMPSCVLCNPLNSPFPPRNMLFLSLAINGENKSLNDKTFLCSSVRIAYMKPICTILLHLPAHSHFSMLFEFRKTIFQTPTNATLTKDKPVFLGKCFNMQIWQMKYYNDIGTVIRFKCNIMFTGFWFFLFNSVSKRNRYELDRHVMQITHKV